MAVNQYVPKYIDCKIIKKRDDGDKGFLEKDHFNAIEDNYLFKDTRIGNGLIPSGTSLIDVINYVADEAIIGKNRIDSISVNHITQPIDINKNVDITVPTKLSDLAQDENHRVVSDGEKATWNAKQNTIAWQSDNYDPISNKAITKSDLDAAVAPLARTTHWRGVFNSLDEVTNPQNGDIAAVGYKEYVYCTDQTPAGWRELGDEDSYIHKGEVTNADVKADAAIAQSKIAGLVDALAEKVVKEVGKSLVLDTEIAKIHTHDNKAALDNITQSAWDTVVANSNQVPNKVDKSTTIAGVNLEDHISKEEMLTALNVEDGAQVNKIETIKLNSDEATPIAIVNKNVTIIEEDPVFTTWKNGEIICAGKDTSGDNTSCISIGSGAKTEDWGTAVGVNSFARCGLALGPDAKAGASGDSENLAAIAIGRYSQATKKNSIAIGGNDPSNTAKANAVGAVQIAIGTNNTENTLQFRNTQIVNSSGKIVSANLDIDIDQKISDAISAIIYEDAQGGHIKISDNYTLNISPTGAITATYPTV